MRFGDRIQPAPPEMGDDADVDGHAYPPPPPRPARQRGRFTEAEAAGIEARARYWALPWWRRWREPRPPTWEQTTRQGIQS